MHTKTLASRMRRRLRHRSAVSVAVVALSATLLTACGSGDDGDSSTAGNGELKVAVYPGALMSLPAYVGQDAGIFEDHDLDVTLVDISDGRNMTAAVGSGSVDLELNSIDNNALAREGGQDIVAVSGNIVRPVFSLLAATSWDTPHLEEGFPASVEDLKGARVGVMAIGGSVEQFTRYVLSAAGLDPDKDVTVVNAGLPAVGVPALKSGQIDAYMAIEPAPSLAVGDDSAKMILDLRAAPLPDELSALDWPYNQWASTTRTVEAKSSQMADFQAAMKDVFAFMSDPANLPELKQIALAHISDDETLVDNLLNDVNLGSFGSELSEDRVDAAFGYLHDAGLIKAPVPYEDYVVEGARS